MRAGSWEKAVKLIAAKPAFEARANNFYYSVVHVLAQPTVVGCVAPLRITTFLD